MVLIEKFRGVLVEDDMTPTLWRLLIRNGFEQSSMPKTTSILTDADWKRRLGEQLKSSAERQGIGAQEIGRRLDRLPGSTGRARTSDWWRYANKGRIPTETQVLALAEALRIPVPVLRVCAGYIDFIFESAFAAVSGEVPETWDFPVPPARAALALLFTLFPRKEGMHIGNTGALFRWLSGNLVGSNLSPEEGFLTGTGWNSTWLYSVRSPEHLIAHHERPDDPSVTWVSIGKPPTEPWTWYSMRAILQIDLASPAASQVFQLQGTAIPKSVALYEAQRIMHSRALPLFVRIENATKIIHDWADALDRNLAAEIREHLHPWDQRTITNEAARWVLGDQIEPDNSTVAPDAPRRAIVQFYLWEVDGRPHDFWL